MSSSTSFADDPGFVGEYTTSDGCVLRYREWRPQERPRAQVISLHGIQSHSGWYGYSSRAMAEAGIAVRFLDRRGSGLNLQNQGHTMTAARLIDDVVDFAKIISSEGPTHHQKPPLILLGLSWGARLAAAVCNRHPDLFDGLILLYPGICTHLRPNPFQRTLLRVLHRFGAGRLKVPLPLHAEQFATDQDWQAFIHHDPLALRKVSVSFLVASESLENSAREGLARLTLPRLVMLAGQDEIVDRTETHELLSNIPAGSLSVIEYPRARHTLEFEPNRDRFVADLINWIESING